MAFLTLWGAQIRSCLQIDVSACPAEFVHPTRYGRFGHDLEHALAQRDPAAVSASVFS